MIQHSYPLTVIYGPTAVGKTDYALALAERVGGTIINADVGQFYAPLSIGTAKPSLPHPTIEHYLFDYCTEPRDVTVVEYRAQVQEVLRKNLPFPIIVGGSGFYVNSLFFPPLAVLSSVSQQDFADETISWQLLHEVDPERATQIHPHDTYRIKRALELVTKTGAKASAYKPLYNPIAYTIMIIFLERERADLYARINERVEHMMDLGWLHEVKEIMHKPGWKDFLLRKKLLGYPEIIEYVEHDGADIKNLITNIAQKTRNYAKRQLSFGRMLAKKLHEYESFGLSVQTVNLTLLDHDLYINTQAMMLKSKLKG